MDSVNAADPQTTLNNLKGLELKARMIVEGYVSGMHKSPYHGFSVEFAEHREYVPGDDLRYVDWKVFGKSDRIYLKQYDEETNFVSHLLVDTSESMAYKSDAAVFSKLEYAQYIAAAFAYLIIHQQDGVGMATFDSCWSIWFLPRPGSTPGLNCASFFATCLSKVQIPANRRSARSFTISRNGSSGGDWS